MKADWFSVKRNTIKEKTAYDYKKLLKKYIYPALGKIKLKDLSTYRITKFYAGMKEHGKGTRTIQITHTILRSALQDALRNGILGRNPCDGAFLPRDEQKEMKVLSESQVTKFLIAAE